MMIKYELEVDKNVILSSFSRITNQIFRLLPLREEGGDWISPLENLIVEIVGIERLLINQIDFFILVSKMEGLFSLTKEEDFMLFRKNIFECLSLLTAISKEIEDF